MADATESSNKPSRRQRPRKVTIAPDQPALIELRNLGVYFKLNSRKVPLKHRLLKRASRAAGSAAGPSGEAPVLWALRHVDLQLYEGQIVGIVGHNGSGKSTLCMVLSKILSPDAGFATVRGSVSTVLSLRSGVNNDLSGRANIQLYASYLGIPKERIEAQMEEIIEFSELGEFIDEPVRTYSSGMRSRLAFAVATTLQPEILILDEVISVGDSGFRRKSRQRIGELMQQSKLIVVVSHSTSFLRRICTHCLWLERGEVKMFARARKVISAYRKATRKTSRLDAAPPPIERTGPPAPTVRQAWAESKTRLSRVLASRLDVKQPVEILGIDDDEHRRLILTGAGKRQFLFVRNLANDEAARLQRAHELCAANDVPVQKLLEVYPDVGSTQTAIFRYAPGTRARPLMRPRPVGSAGLALGKLHAIAVDDGTLGQSLPSRALDPEPYLRQWAQDVARVTAALGDEAGDGAALLGWLGQHAGAIAHLSRPHLCHGRADLRDIVVDGYSAATLINWQHACFDVPGFELAGMLWRLCQHGHKRRQALLRAYEPAAGADVWGWWTEHAIFALAVSQLHETLRCLRLADEFAGRGGERDALDLRAKAYRAWARAGRIIEDAPDARGDLSLVLEACREADVLARRKLKAQMMQNRPGA